MTRLDLVRAQDEPEPTEGIFGLRIHGVEKAEFDEAEEWARILQPVAETSENGVDLDQATRAVADLLDALGIDRTSDGLAATPARVARAYAEMLSPEPFHVTTFPNDEGYDELVLARAIPFASLCEHHLLPFSGLAYVGYLPDERLLGLSKLVRVVDTSPAACRCRSVSRCRWPISSPIPCSPRASASSSRANTSACHCVGFRPAGPRP
jgi:hypothetical protein